MITRLDPLLPVETPLGKGNAIFYFNANTIDEMYWVINENDQSLRLFSKNEIRIATEGELSSVAQRGGLLLIILNNHKDTNNN
jgi:hypothetical protein